MGAATVGQRPALVLRGFQGFRQSALLHVSKIALMHGAGLDVMQDQALRPLGSHPQAGRIQSVGQGVDRDHALAGGDLEAVFAHHQRTIRVHRHRADSVRQGGQWDPEHSP